MTEMDGIEDSQYLDILMREREVQYQNLRADDAALHQLAFAYIAAFSLCVPAMLSSDCNLSDGRLPAALFIVCTLVFIGGFYALMIVHARNRHWAHIAFLSDRVNDLVVSKRDGRDEILFQNSEEISGFYFGAKGGLLWKAAYLVFFGTAGVGLIVAAVFVIAEGELLLGIAMFMEMGLAVAAYSAYFRVTGGGRKVKRRMDVDYRKWLSRF